MVFDKQSSFQHSRFIFALLHTMNLKGLIFQAAVHNGFRESASAVQTLEPQESWEDICAAKSKFQSLDEHLSPLSRTKTFSL